MDDSARVVTRGWLMMWIGTALLAGGLVTLCLPVYLASYDRYGVQIRCGNGYDSELLQAGIEDKGQPSAQFGASTPVWPRTNYVDQCKSALVHRRAWLVPVAALGVLILVPELLVWSRAGQPEVDRNVDGRSSDVFEFRNRLGHGLGR
jgi:hypothetical protein